MTYKHPTPSQTVGPFFGFALLFEGAPIATDHSASGTVRVEGVLLDGEGEPVSDGLLEIWSPNQFARCRTDIEGSFHFVIERPSKRPGGAEAPYLDVIVFARGLLRHLVTRMYFPDEPSNADDPVLTGIDERRRGTLVATRAGAVLRFDIRLRGEQETVFFAV